MTVRRLALQASLALDHKPRWKRALHHAAKHYKGELHVGQPLWFWRRGANAAKKPTNAFWHPGVVTSNTLATVWITYRGSAVKGPDGEGQMDVDPEARRRMRGKTRPISLEQPTSSQVNASPDATPQEVERDHDDKRRRIDELVSPVSTVAQDEVSTLSPVLFGSETRNDEIAVDVPLPEEPTEMSGESGQGWITEEAFFTVSPCVRQVRQRKEVKMKQLSLVEKREFLKSMEVEWQTLLKNQAARVLSMEEAAQARARWPDRAMDTRWARTWNPDESKPSGRRAEARLIVKGLTDLLDIESTLTREGFMTVF